jgi:hypothetical protein
MSKKHAQPAKAPTLPSDERRATSDETHPLPRLSLLAARDSLEGNASLDLLAEAHIFDDEENDDPPAFTLDAYSGGIMYPRLNGMYWDEGVVINIAGLRARDAIPTHRAHDDNRPVGHCSAELGDRIRCSGVFSVDTDDTRIIRSSSKRGFPWRASVGLTNMTYEIVEAGARIQANGQTFDGPLLYVTSAELVEVSFVTIAGDPAVEPAVAANRLTHTSSYRANTMTFEKWLKAHGWTGTLSASLRQSLMAAYHQEIQASGQGAQAASGESGDDENSDESADAESDDFSDSDADDESDDDESTSSESSGSTATASRNRQTTRQATAQRNTQLDATTQRIRTQAAAEESRISGIREICQRIGNPTVEGTDQQLVAHAIGEGWDVNRTALYATRHTRPSAPAIHSHSREQQCSLEALQAGMMLRANRAIDQQVAPHPQLPDWMSRPVNDAGRQQIMEAANRYRDLEMIDYVAHGLQAMGRDLPANNLGRSGRLATLQAGFSTGAVSAIFTQSIGAVALMAYMESGDFTEGWTTEEDVPNLIETDRPRMSAAPDLTHHPTGGEAEHAHRSANNEKVKADRFSRTMEVDENDFINDRFQLLRDTPRDFGRAARRLRPNMVAAVLLANDTLADGTALFHADHNNLLSSAALSQDNLRAARAALSKVKDGDANLNLQASHLVVPSDLGDLAVQLVMSAVISNDSGTGQTNPLRMRNIMPVDEGRLANGVVNPLTGNSLAGSLTTWYLISNEGHTIEVQFLEGTGRVPQVIVNQLTGGKFGLEVTVKHFIGAKALDYRGMIRADA